MADLINSIMPILALFGSALSLYVTWQKINSKSKDEAVWRALVDDKLQRIVDSVKDLRETEKTNTQLISSLSSDLTAINFILKQHAEDIHALEKKLDELRGDVKENSNKIAGR